MRRFGAGFFKTLVISVAVLLLGLQMNAYRFGEHPVVSLIQQNQNVAAVEASGTFGQTLAWVESVGYFVIFLALLIEGPIVNAAAAFAAALGYFNIWIIVALAILGDLVADLIYYAIGYFGRLSLIERFGHRFGLSRERMRHIERLLNTHPTKTLVVIKLMPVIPTPGLMLVGVTRMPLRKFITLSALIILPKVALFTVLGYYFGQTYNSVTAYIQNGEYFIAIAIVAVLAVWWVYNKSTELVARQLETV